MGRAPSHKTERKYKPKEQKMGCKKQFPDCPPEPNETNCKICPFYSH